MAKKIEDYLTFQDIDSLQCHECSFEHFPNVQYPKQWPSSKTCVLLQNLQYSILNEIDNENKHECDVEEESGLHCQEENCPGECHKCYFSRVQAENVLQELKRFHDLTDDMAILEPNLDCKKTTNRCHGFVINYDEKIDFSSKVSFRTRLRSFLINSDISAMYVDGFTSVNQYVLAFHFESPCDHTACYLYAVKNKAKTEVDTLASEEYFLESFQLPMTFGFTAGDKRTKIRFNTIINVCK